MSRRKAPSQYRTRSPMRCRRVIQDERDPATYSGLQTNLLTPWLRYELRNEIAHVVDLALETYVNRKAAVMCPRCGHTGRRVCDRDLETGYCVGLKNCAARRRDLDLETIEYLGLES